MLTLYLTRHGETEWNVEKRMQGWQDSLLTEKGRNDAKRLGKRLEAIDLDAIYTSTSKRAVDTAQLIRGARDIPIYLDENLREIHFGDWEGKTHDEIKQLDPDGFDCFWNQPHLYIPKKGERIIDVQNRAFDAVNKIIEKQKNGHVLIVTHGVVLKALLALFKQLPLEQFWASPVMHGTSLTIVRFNGHTFDIVAEGDIEHLGEIYENSPS